MPESYIPGMVRVLVQYTIGTEQCENVYSFRRTTAVTNADCDALAQQFGSELWNKQREMLGGHCVLRQVIAKDISSEGSSQGIWVPTSNQQGSRLGNQVPYHSAANVTLRTGLVGKGQHGAKSYSGFMEQDVEGNALEDFLLQRLLELAVILLKSWVGGKFFPVIAKPKFHTYAVLRSVAMKDSWVDSQKSRLTGHGD